MDSCTWYRFWSRPPSLRALPGISLLVQDTSGCMAQPRTPPDIEISGRYPVRAPLIAARTGPPGLPAWPRRQVRRMVKKVPEMAVITGGRLSGPADRA
jgi:hypothetical protein